MMPIPSCNLIALFIRSTVFSISPKVKGSGKFSHEGERERSMPRTTAKLCGSDTRVSIASAKTQRLPVRDNISGIGSHSSRGMLSLTGSSSVTYSSYVSPHHSLLLPSSCSRSPFLPYGMEEGKFRNRTDCSRPIHFRCSWHCDTCSEYICL